MLALIWHLKRQGWKEVDRRCDHQTAAIATFDGAEAIKQRSYLQCVAALEKCITLTSHMPSRCPVGCYKLLLRGLRAEPDMSAKDYTAILNVDLRKRWKMAELVPLEDAPAALMDDNDPDGVICPGPGGEPPSNEPMNERGPRVVREGHGREGPVRPGSSSDPPGVQGGGGEGGVDPDPVPIHCGGVAGPPGPEPADHDDPDGIVGGSAAAAPRPQGRRLGQGVFYDGLLGARLQCNPYTKPSGGGYPNYTIYCTDPTHPGCGKTKGRVPSNMKRWGEMEPLAFLHCWLAIRDPVKKHNLCDPSPEQVDAFVAGHLEELQDLLARMGHS